MIRKIQEVYRRLTTSDSRNAAAPLEMLSILEQKLDLFRENREYFMKNPIKYKSDIIKIEKHQDLKKKAAKILKKKF